MVEMDAKLEGLEPGDAVERVVVEVLF